MVCVMSILDFLKEYSWGIGLAVQAFIAYHILFLSKKLTLTNRLEHKDKIKSAAEDYIHRIHKEKLRRKVYLVDIKKYFKYYPNNSSSFWKGYSHISGEIKSVRYNGIEFFSSSPRSVYRKSDGSLSFSEGDSREEVDTVFPVSIIPYEWIESIDTEGDEFAYVPLFYCNFKGWVFWKMNWFLPFRYPYKNTIYYKKSETYREGSDPYGMEYVRVYDKISKK